MATHAKKAKAKTAPRAARKPATPITKRPGTTMKKKTTKAASKSVTKRVTAMKKPTAAPASSKRTVHAKDIVCNFSQWLAETIDLALTHSQNTRNFIDKSKVELRPTAVKEIRTIMRTATKFALKHRKSIQATRDKKKRLAAA